ncbi:gliding motility-associated C-terminal domain-containing protein [uncultured Sunxiuqinia sp.]|uniref:T9SS type B sorting domain-containing protein n=1 Tax=uncultured Sunxiuqinia sp. TaxID=1573825 RepID=UPI00261971EE|nr:gliding motility-associated C-terminal domain-containing protein [uncultured Sunxiuqinia sp.]
MKKEIAIGLISLFILITGVIKLQAQTSYFIGQEISFEVEAVDENEYLWGVFLDENALIPANQDSYDFIASAEESHTKLVFHKASSYFIVLLETNPLGCSTGRSLPIEVVPTGDLGLAVTNASTTQCYQEGNNDFSVELQFLDDQGSFWTADRFPVRVSFTVNDVPQPTQTVSYLNQQLHIPETAFEADPTQNTVVSIQLIEVTDKQNLTIPAREGKDIQTTTLVSAPEISFNTNEDEVAFGTISAYSVQGASAYTYSWTLSKPNGGLLQLSSETNTTEPINWNLSGVNRLSVQATNQAGCSSQVYTRTIVVLPQEDRPVAIIETERLETGSCGTVRLDASKSTGVGKLSYSWSPTAGLDDPASPTPLLRGEASARYTVTVTDSRGKTATDDVFVEVLPSPQIGLDRQVFVNSPNEVILLDASSSAGTDLSFNWWSSGDGLLVSGAQTATPQVLGLGKYYLQVTDRFGCSALDSVVVGLLVQVTAADDQADVLVNTYADINVLRNDAPKGQLDPQSITIVSPPSQGVAHVTSDSIITYTPNPYYVGADEFIYAVCDYSNHCDEANVLVRISDEALFIPNAFSPNGDGINDYFEIIGIDGYERVKLRILNRWGSLIYESNNYGRSGDGFWDGTASKGIRFGDGQIATGTYYYILDLGRGKEKVTGFVYLDR